MVWIVPAATLEIDLPAHRLRIESARDALAFEAALTDEGYPPEPDAAA